MIVNNYRTLRTQPDTDALCSEDLLALQFWKWNSSITVDLEQHLVQQGYEDLRGTAKTYQLYYPTVLPKNYNDSYYLVRPALLLLICCTFSCYVPLPVLLPLAMLHLLLFVMEKGKNFFTYSTFTFAILLLFVQLLFLLCIFSFS